MSQLKPYSVWLQGEDGPRTVMVPADMKNPKRAAHSMATASFPLNARPLSISIVAL